MFLLLAAAVRPTEPWSLGHGLAVVGIALVVIALVRLLRVRRRR